MSQSGKSSESNEPTIRASSPRHWIVPALAFAAFGGLVGWRIGAGVPVVAIGAVVGAVFAAVGALLLVLALGLAHPRLDRPVIHQSAANGFLLLVPFAVLALVAELLLGWNASLAFAAAGLMTAGGAVGAEVARRGGGRWRSMLMPSLFCFALATLWTLAGAGAGSVVGR